jgi:hypothetical protein
LRRETLKHWLKDELCDYCHHLRKEIDTSDPANYKKLFLCGITRRPFPKHRTCDKWDKRQEGIVYGNLVPVYETLQKEK